MDSVPEQHGCEHYTRRCRIRAPCCGEVFGCRHCHNESKNSLEVDLRDRHEIPRHEIKKVICSLCSKEQDVQQNCSNCGACMGKYFCEKCKFFDDDVSKNQYHCDGCGICRTGGIENFFHCEKCGCCYSNVLKDSHHCVERAMHHNCPVCFEYLFDSTKDISVLRCGHTIHLECLSEMRVHHHFSCPVCSRSACDMTEAWQKLDEEVAATPMPEFYQKKMEPNHFILDDWTASLRTKGVKKPTMPETTKTPSLMCTPSYLRTGLCFIAPLRVSSMGSKWKWPPSATCILHRHSLKRYWHCALDTLIELHAVTNSPERADGWHGPHIGMVVDVRPELPLYLWMIVGLTTTMTQDVDVDGWRTCHL